jgi:hypothetical protein
MAMDVAADLDERGAAGAKPRVDLALERRAGARGRGRGWGGERGEQDDAENDAGAGAVL